MPAAVAAGSPMPDLLAALLLGIIEGITEFLPISSTGHLLIAEHWLGARSDLFNIAIQAGAILAVVAIYWRRLWQLLLGFAQKSNRDYVLKLLLAFAITGALGLAVKKLGFQLPETLGPVAWALLVGGFVILAVEAIDARRSDLPDADPDAIGWGTAVLVGLAQVLAGVFPGTSRSAAAIFAALLFGRSSRVAATEFAFLVGIPTMFAATGYELLHTLKDGGAANEDWTALGVAFVVSALTAFAAVKWLLRYIQTHRFTIFAWYRIALGALLLALAWTGAAGFQDASAQARADGKEPTLSGESAARAANANAPAQPWLAFTDLPAQTQPARAESWSTMDKAQLQALYERRKYCLSGAQLQHGADEAGTQEHLLTMDNLPTDPRERQERLDGYTRAFEHIDEVSRNCHESLKPMLDGSMYELALRAADDGDRDAALCYVSGSFPTGAAMLRRPDLRLRFAVNASRMLERSVEAGDWRMVQFGILALNADREHWKLDLPAHPLDSPGINLSMTIAPQGDSVRSYRLWKLLALGDAAKAGRGDVESASIAEDYAKRLDPAQRREADAWANRTFAVAFQGRGPESHNVDTCK
jgi:undecaprenyl-diphosphatase